MPLVERPRTFELCGGNLRAFRDRTSREQLLSGPAGTGKTFANLARLLQFGSDNPGARMLIVRKTRKALSESALVTWERDVLGPRHPMLARPVTRSHRDHYRFPNGSLLVTAGIDIPEKILSSEWDVVYVNEATELDEADWQFLGMRLRAGATGYDLLIADCNPNSPKHWLYLRCLAGRCKLYPTHHYENPRYYDYRAKTWTDAGRRYINGRLKNLTGTRKERFLHGKWVAAEGAVYSYVPLTHDKPANWVPDPSWKRVWAIDWGKRAPTVLQFWAVDPAARMYLYREQFKCNMRADELGRWVKSEMEHGREPRPYGAVCDIDSEDRPGLFTQASGVDLEIADKADRDKGIQDTQARFDLASDGLPRIFFRDGARDHDPDINLVDEGRPASTIDELVGYVWDPKFVKDEPIAENDHGMDAMRYACRWVDTNLVGVDPHERHPTPEPLLPARYGTIR